MAFAQPQRLPAAAEAIHRALLAAPGRRLKRDSIVDRTHPGLESQRSTVTSTLHELRAVRAIVGDDDALRLRDDIGGSDKPGGLASIVLRSMIEDAATRDFWTADETDGVSLEGGLDVVRACTWFLTLPVDGGPWAWDRSPRSFQQRQVDDLPMKVIGGETRWLPFVRWATYLGLATALDDGVVLPDPSKAVRPVLRALIVRRGDQPLAGVLTHLREQLPMLDGGTFHAQLVERVEDTRAGNLSSAMSFCLTSLAREGLIEFEEGRGDAEKVTFAHGLGAYHAVRWVGGAV